MKATKKHPHGRGEDGIFTEKPNRVPETPPRAWGRQKNERTKIKNFRNTPTGVGKTFKSPTFTSQKRKHPHGRGEDNV
ncbi:hypothetical conserved protein [Candidatus Nitrosoglobus terrae]|uniref:Hypothetical conserved protein n=1 Tax=Candidatus Nitrosoglobus terrae TaxID=1630141 RepID=A0A1Q2SPM5_9GAMM|nr:hypothetical conserved protein [Candidatus Nitrosoglobus terrae]